MAENPLKTLVIDNFQGRLTRYKNGDINSGYAKYNTTFGNDPFTDPGNLTWFQEPQGIDSLGVVITDLIMAMKPRLESGVTYVYAVGHTGRLYKIQVNDPTTYNPNYDNPVLLTTLTSNAPTFKYGASIQFFGATEKIYIGHDLGVTSVNFDGTGEAFVGIPASYTANVPRPSANFTGSLYFGNGSNIAQIDSTATVVTYAKLSPGFPAGTQVRDVDVSPDGNYLQITVSRVAQADMTTTTQDTSSLSSSDSYVFLWNGTDLGYTAFNPYNTYSINSNISFGEYGYTMGYDQNGAAIYSGPKKLVTLQNFHSPNFSAMFSTGNLLGIAAPEAFAPDKNDQLFASLLAYGSYDEEIPTGLYRFFTQGASGADDVIQVPACSVVSNLFYGSSSAGYADSQVGSAKLYFSTFETTAAPTTRYGLYKFLTVPSGDGVTIQGVYETQTQIFSKKIKISQIRIYTKPMVLNNSFQISLIGSSDDVITNSDFVFEVGTTVNVGQDYCWYSPDIEPTYAVGVRIENTGDINMVISKIEIDYSAGGQ